ncbi:ATP-binding protein [Kitasatospora sp. NPDC059648]|uniref:ATP-binding protein n=1 Tax=Kitasatospora sp. NPDC059648 TaxID=3346894 RepID=UPI0036CE82B1
MFAWLAYGAEPKLAVAKRHLGTLRSQAAVASWALDHRTPVFAVWQPAGHWDDVQMSHDDRVRRLGKKFANACYPTFGPMLMGIRGQGFRGVSDLSLQFKSPVTAISGLNGTGKSTVAQLAAAGFRQPPDHDWYRYYVKHFSRSRSPTQSRSPLAHRSSTSMPRTCRRSR